METNNTEQKQSPKSYCEFVATGISELHRNYHDQQYGFPIEDDNELFGRLILEINQAGLSWTTILKKQESFRKAYADFDIETIAAFSQNDRERLMNDTGIIRNKLKINAAIENAKAILELRKEFGSFKAWIDQHHPKTKEEWVKTFKKTFKFTGGEIVNEFLMSTGYLPGSHIESCPVHAHILNSNPPFLRK
jgi:DNA-3-methyladenine glycosylase I